MNFRPELAAKVMAGEKTVTRRVMSDNPRSPWWRDRCSLIPGHDYAVCPGRGKNAIGRVTVIRVQAGRVGWLRSDHDAQREGFPTVEAFRDAWAEINGQFDPATPVWVVEMDAVA